MYDGKLEADRRRERERESQPERELSCALSFATGAVIKYGLYFPGNVTQEQQSFTLFQWMDRHGGASGHSFAVYDGLIRLLSGMYNVFEKLF